LQALGHGAEVSAALSRQNLEVPAGRVRRGTSEQLVRVTGRITSPAQFGDVIVATRMASRARERRGAGRGWQSEERSLALLDGKRAISINSSRCLGRTPSKCGRRPRRPRPHPVRASAGASLRVVRDNSTFIRNSIHDVINELMTGALLTVLIVMLFLNDWKATAITSLALRYR